ncbi:hypothetical protein ABWH96_20530 [Marivirga tractuosa]|uniref:hypothetical protein n=1 Tax=Marivirga tractuosa TaxID=1006 RepID=UPI0035D1020F
MKNLFFSLFLLSMLGCSSSDENRLNNSFENCISTDTKETFSLLEKNFEELLIREGLETEQNQPDYGRFVFEIATLCDIDPPIFFQYKADSDLLNLIRENKFDQLIHRHTDNSENFFSCFKRLNIPKNSTLNSYLEVKNQVGDISPRLIARGLLYHTKDEEYNDKLVRKIILKELYLPYIIDYNQSKYMN